MSGVSVDAELYGQQEDVVIYITIATWYGCFVEIPASSYIIGGQRISYLGCLDSILGSKWNGIYTVL